MNASLYGQFKRAMLLSVRIVTGLREVRQYGTVQFEGDSSLMRLYEHISNGSLDGYILPEEYTDSPARVLHATQVVKTTHLNGCN